MVPDLFYVLQWYCGVIYVITTWQDLTLLLNLKLDWILTFSINTFNQRHCHVLSSFVNCVNIIFSLCSLFFLKSLWICLSFKLLLLLNHTLCINIFRYINVYYYYSIYDKHIQLNNIPINSIYFFKKIKAIRFRITKFTFQLLNLYWVPLIRLVITMMIISIVYYVMIR